MKNVNGSLIGIALNLNIALGSMAIFMILILPIHEHGMFFQLFEQWFVVLLVEIFYCYRLAELLGILLFLWQL